MSNISMIKLLEWLKDYLSHEISDWDKEKRPEWATGFVEGETKLASHLKSELLRLSAEGTASWISVKEKRPTAYTPVLVFFNNASHLPNEMDVSWMIDLHEQGIIWENRGIDGIVTHWMSLPKPPTKEV